MGLHGLLQRYVYLLYLKFYGASCKDKDALRWIKPKWCLEGENGTAEGDIRCIKSYHFE
jgi:hypothetical protein